MLNINKIYYLPCWYLYMDLIETRYNPEQTQFYDWSSIYDNDMFYDLHLLFYYKNYVHNFLVSIFVSVPRYNPRTRQFLPFCHGSLINQNIVDVFRLYIVY